MSNQIKQSIFPKFLAMGVLLFVTYVVHSLVVTPASALVRCGELQINTDTCSFYQWQNSYHCDFGPANLWCCPKANGRVVNGRCVIGDTNLSACDTYGRGEHTFIDCVSNATLRGGLTCIDSNDTQWKCCGPGFQINRQTLTCESATTPTPISETQTPTTGSPTDTLTSETFDSLNPLKQYSSGVEEDLSKPAGIITRVMRFGFPLAGLILFVMLVWAGFEIVAGAAGKKSIDAGKQRATAAVIGFVLLFVSYWIAQLLEIIFGVQIL